MIHSDGCWGDDGLVDVGCNKHLRTNYDKEYRLGHDQHVNRIVKLGFYLHLKESEWQWKRKPAKMPDEVVELFYLEEIWNQEEPKLCQKTRIQMWSLKRASKLLL